MALSWHQPRQQVSTVFRDGVLKVRCSVCDTVMEVTGQVDLSAARQFCAAHRHHPPFPVVPEQHRPEPGQ